MKIKKAKATRKGNNIINPKNREKNGKIIQGWWPERKQKYDKILEQIIKIQSVYRGRILRKRCYYIIAIYYFYQKILDIIGGKFGMNFSQGKNY